MVEIYSDDDFRRDPFLAVEPIANLLRHGSLMLFLGSGVSIGFGLPDWKFLVARILGRADDETFMAELESKTDKDLAKLIDDVDDGSESYITKVHGALYQTISNDLKERLSLSPLLLGVAGLMTGSCRGRISTVITYNYDDLLKQYLQMLGYSICTRTASSTFTTWSDVEINHVHGYLPQSRIGESKPGAIILSDKSYRERRAHIDAGWPSYIEHCLYSKNGLFLGLSGDDSSILDVCERAKGEIKRSEDYNGYWLMTPKAYDRNYKSILSVHMCPIRLEVESFPKFVFDVCQSAMGT